MSKPIDLSLLKELELEWRCRPVSIHDAPCRFCPSKHGEPDEITKDFMAAPREEQLDSVFCCAWRPEKACRGYCDRLQVGEAELAAFNQGRDL